MLNFALLDEILHSARHVFDRHIWIGAVLVKEIDDIRPQPVQGSVRDFSDALGRLSLV